MEDNCDKKCSKALYQSIYFGAYAHTKQSYALCANCAIVSLRCHDRYKPAYKWDDSESTIWSIYHPIKNKTQKNGIDLTRTQILYDSHESSVNLEHPHQFGASDWSWKHLTKIQRFGASDRYLEHRPTGRIDLKNSKGSFGASSNQHLEDRPDLLNLEHRSDIWRNTCTILSHGQHSILAIEYRG